MVSEKIKTVIQLQEILGDLKKSGKKIVQCHGTFDLLHPGHLKHLEAARSYGDILVVTITADAWVNRGPGRPIYNQNVRAQFLAGMQCVHFVAIDDKPTPIEILKRLKPDIFVKGGDYEEKAREPHSLTHEEKRVVESYGGQIKFTHEDLVFSSSQLLNDFFYVFPESTQVFLNHFKKVYDLNFFTNYFEKTRRLKILTVGDTIIDEYHYGDVVGGGSKENMLVFKYKENEMFAGGAVATANNISLYSQFVELCTCLGCVDSKENFVRDHLKPNVSLKPFYRSNGCTVVNRRFAEEIFVAKLFEEYFINDEPLDVVTEKKVCDYLEKIIDDYDLVVVNDFGFGFIGPQVIDLVCKRAKFLAVNTQTNSVNRGFNLITKYSRADYVCIDQPELRLAFSNKYGDIQDMIYRLVEKMLPTKVAITLGHDGSMTHDVSKDQFYKIPVFSKKIVDRVGAGDAYFSVTTPCVFAGMPMDAIGFLGNAVGAIAVTIVCNRSSVEPPVLTNFIKTLLK
ncbi:MAG: hypothetical protein A2W61_06325 [Deltaproteobacteria bacterium RIFCSPLOWO2_01_44_7]|nr:MAG: hypothetical protein A2712_02825 [Deltaproteobacteria bacterium RIFCSPHIGHO2_01_FULL_43_49]OGQ16129.1 MAG: hypothetical protein A3D22_00795 [Deltaproteobacteria bacterium RIFCSPHIGHO2_02_FULL_44_53]OGQ29090.1 MAG: hypothetical protein A3D98_04580 [Deltaproteobacteria bacterium RIFCSPHIGHO2_12_FULL_44_21]OGQ32646.1 MAG: hypothetical protein A2979_08725 [Deltaproteobacteria bacterium RIFCSPLOWO2_01_FULL_45_74]OGQ38032.1 MAG: hypothetical protein A2W61_06325 [Deltaproteobacteria bacterium 